MNLDTLLGENAYWQVNKKIASKVGIEGALLLANFISLEREFKNKGTLGKDGYFFQTSEKIQDNVFIGYKTQKRLINLLKKEGFLEKKLKGVPAKLHFKICSKSIVDFLLYYIEGKDTKEDTEEQKEDKTSFTQKDDTVLPKGQNYIKRINKKNNIINNNISKDILQEKPESSENSYIENGVEKFGNKKINTLLLFLCKSIGIDEFKETQKQQRLYGKHFLNYIDNKIGKYEFVKRLNGILKDEFKSKNSNSIKYLYNEIKSFIHSPLIENKKNIDAGIVLTDMEF